MSKYNGDIDRENYYVYHVPYSKSYEREHIGVTWNIKQRNNHHKCDEITVLEVIPKNGMNALDHWNFARDREEYWQLEYGLETDKEKVRKAFKKAGQNPNSWNWKKQWLHKREEMLVHASNARKGKKGIKHKVTEKTMRAVKIAAAVAHREVECPHCGKLGGHAVMQRWHFDNCKKIN